MPREVLERDDVPTGFADFVAAREGALRRFAWLVTGDWTECADLVQEALEKAWPKWDALVSRGTHEAYLRRSITNGAVSRWRKQRRVVLVAEPVERVDAEADPATKDADEAWQLCAELPPLQRAAVVLRFHEDLSYADIAALLECAEATARSHVHRALVRLRARLDAGGE